MVGGHFTKMALCMNRLNEERKQWRRDHPFGFYAKPQRNVQGVLDLKVWECGIPGKEKTIWEGGLFKLTMTFPEGMRMPRNPLLAPIHPSSVITGTTYRRC